MNIEIDHTKQAITINDDLTILSNILMEHIEEQAEQPNENFKFLASLEKSEDTDALTQHLNDTMFFLKWAYSYATDEDIVTKDELHMMEFCNNLDSVLDYEDGFNSPIEFIFPTIECVRQNMGSQTVLFCGQGVGNGITKIYMSTNTESYEENNEL